MVVNIGQNNSIFNQFIAELRDANIQADRMRFRRTMERIGEIFAYEISKQLEYENREVTTSLGVAVVSQLKNYPVLATILRAGLPLHQGLLNVFDKSDNAFISCYREHRKDDQFAIKLEYVSSPDLEGKVLIISDPMLATAHSMIATYKELLKISRPAHIHIVAVLASAQGIEMLKRVLPKKGVTIWVGAVDDELTAHGYIVPGLGDAGDLAFGSKV